MDGYQGLTRIEFTIGMILLYFTLPMFYTAGLSFGVTFSVLLVVQSLLSIGRMDNICNRCNVLVYLACIFVPLIPVIGWFFILYLCVTKSRTNDNVN